jgi:hypothetical protein
MQLKGISLNEMVDVYGFRIIVDTADTCYRTLGLVHSVYKPMPGRFKDYIAIPAGQRLSVAAYDACSGRTAYRSKSRSVPSRCTASPNPASPPTGNINPAARRSAASSTTVHANGSPASCKSRKAAAPRSFSRASRSTCFRTRSTYSRRRARSCACRHGRDRGRFCVCDSYRRRQSLRRRQGGSTLGAAAHAAAQWPDRRDHHRQGRDAESVLVRFSGHRQGTRRDSAILEEHEARRSRGTRPPAARILRSRNSR